VAGTGPVEDGSADHRSVNRAVVLSRGGRVLATQDKRHGFTLTHGQIASWGLEPDLGPEARAESLAKRRHLTVLESTIGRFCVLVCEDLGRAVEDGTLVAEVGSSHILAPVLSKPTLPHYWEHSDAKTWASAIGANTVVANSLVIAEAMARAGLEPDDDRLGTALAHSADGTFEWTDAADAAALVVLRLAPEGAVVGAQLFRD
jgi:predicted amidohydrolase